MDSHIVVLFGFCHKLYPVRSITIVQYHFRCKLHMSVWSHQCPIWFLSLTIPSQSIMTTQFHLRHRSHLYDRSVKSLSCMVFLIGHTQSDRSWQFSFGFGLDQTYKIAHIVFLSSFRQTSYLVQINHDRLVSFSA